ncbi:alcohol dehydrogenase catalytic domain-containing protein [Paenibacillus nasutitermitis]|uniref:Alcohol dehydrogenase n=1 Tax=Paenibacillus nasutitermitis TaxID=1652958 RepID=A0A917DPN8_9BACL|nr:alcohol dehydrogenase catalytic domain-containing protein [Paenibacillus nasutitermitis]GGD59055.1 alcohol dehydrogenase [Paenibacillus nasutitermitis]
MMTADTDLSPRMTVPLFVGQGTIAFGSKEIPVTGDGELLIQVKANALCGSDRGQFYDGTPVTPGHEAAGLVIAGGTGTTTSPGTPGVVFLMAFCGECSNCKNDFTNLCLNKQADYGFSDDGGYAPYMVVKEHVFFPIDPQIPFAEATLLLDIMGTGGHAIKRAQRIRPDINSILIAGAGPIGLGVLAMAKLLLGQDKPVYVMDYVPYRLELAEKLGAIPIHLGNMSVSDVVRNRGHAGIDVAVDTSGKTAARQMALEALNKRGVLVCVGHGQELHLQVSNDLIATERAVLGSEYFQFHELAENHELLLKHLPYLSQIITHRCRVDHIQQAYEMFFEGQTGKVVIEQ